MCSSHLPAGTGVRVALESQGRIPINSLACLDESDPADSSTTASLPSVTHRVTELR